MSLSRENVMSFVTRTENVLDIDLSKRFTDMFRIEQINRFPISSCVVPPGFTTLRDGVYTARESGRVYRLRDLVEDQ